MDDTRKVTTLEDRRRKRSEDPLIALHYQLAHARHDGALEAIVLADHSGVVVAGAGSWAMCEELAAYAPLLAKDFVWREPGADPASGAEARLASFSLDVEVKSMDLDGQEVFLCARGGWMRTQMIERAAEGVTRILRAA
jgi:hypothetical protein